MEGDRVACLIVEAAVRRVVDFSQVDLLDAGWWRHLRLLLPGIERSMHTEAMRDIYHYRLTLAARPDLTVKAQETNGQAIKELLTHLMGMCIPWERKEHEERLTTEFKDYRQQYIDTFGVDPLDPKFKSWESGKIAQWMEPKAGEESDEARVQQRLLDRLKKQSKGSR